MLRHAALTFTFMKNSLRQFTICNLMCITNENIPTKPSNRVSHTSKINITKNGQALNMYIWLFLVMQAINISKWITVCKPKILKKQWKPLQFIYSLFKKILMFAFWLKSLNELAIRWFDLNNAICNVLVSFPLATHPQSKAVH